MIKIPIFWLICHLTILGHTKAQFADSTFNQKRIQERTFIRAVKVPAMLMSITMLTKTDIEFIGRAEAFEERNEKFPNFHTRLDDYLQYAPVAGVLLLNGLGVKGQNSLGKQMRLLAKSELIMTALVMPLKEITAANRPDNGVLNSFPSGHTAQAFVAATFLHKEYGNQNPLYSVFAFGAATTVAVLRVMNNRHWTNDVLVGAGIGILSTNLAYWMENNRRLRKLKVLAIPTYNAGNIGVGAVIPLK